MLHEPQLAIPYPTNRGKTLQRDALFEAAGEPWLRGLGGVYDQLVSDLGDDPTFGPFVHEIRERWRGRVEAKRWPKFLSH